MLSLVSTSWRVSLAGFAHDVGVEKVECVGVVVVLCGRGNVGTTRPPVLLGSGPLASVQSSRALTSMHEGPGQYPAHLWASNCTNIEINR